MSEQQGEPATTYQLANIGDTAARSRLAALLRDVRAAQEQISALDAMKRDWVAEAAGIAHGLGATRVVATDEGYELRRVGGRCSKVVQPELLLQLGVGLDVVQAATVTRIGEPHWEVRQTADGSRKQQ